MLQCLKDGIPIRVLRQVSGKPNVLYRVLGIALVAEYVKGYFVLQSC